MAAIYRVESRTMGGTYLATLPHRDLQGEILLSKPYGARFTLPLNEMNRDYTSSDIEAGRTEIQIFRNDSLIYTGPLWNIDISSSDNTFKCTSEDLASYFDVRQLESAVSYTGTYGDMAWSLISASQALTGGSLGITRGTAVPGNGPAGTNVKFKNATYLSDALGNLSDGTSGFDWQITPQRVYNQFYPRISSRANVALEFPGNIIKYGINYQGKYARNKIRTIGANSTISSFAVDSASLTKFGVRHYSESQTSITSATLLNAYNGQVLLQRKNPLIVPNLTVVSTLVNPFDGDISLGQITSVNINDGYVNMVQDMRFVGFQYTPGKQGQETFVFYLNDLREV